MLLEISLILLLFWIIYDDFKNREIHLFAVLPAIVLSFSAALRHQDLSSLGFNTLLSLVFIIFIYFNLVLVYSIKNRKLTLIVNQELGLGDILFWLVLMFNFSFTQFVLFFILSIALILLFEFKKKESIPLAGWQAIFFILVLIFGYVIEYNRFEQLFI